MNLTLSIFILIFSAYPLRDSKDAPVTFVVIAHAGVTQSSLSRTELRDIFLGKMHEWRDGLKIVPVTTTGASHEAFLKTYLNHNPVRFRAYWQRMIFTGTKAPPKAISREDITVRYVARTPGALAYVSATLPLDNVRILDITP